MAVGELCNRDVVVVLREENVVEVAKLMRRYHVGDVVVVSDSDGGRVPVGIVTDRDVVVELVAEGVDPASLSAGDVMSSPLFTVTESAELLDTIAQMRARGVRRAPVVDEHGTLIGILTLDDVLEVLAEALNGLARLTAREQRREQEFRA